MSQVILDPGVAGCFGTDLASSSAGRSDESGSCFFRPNLLLGIDCFMIEEK
jgi:hypothetical protein